MFRFMRYCLAIAAVMALCLLSLGPIVLLPLGLCAAGLGIGALFMHITGGFEDPGQPPVFVVTPPRQTIFVSQQPTYSSSLNWSPFSWFSGRGADRHYGHNTRGHGPSSVNGQPAHAVVTHPSQRSSNPHVPAHTNDHGHGPFFSHPPSNTSSSPHHTPHHNSGYSHGRR